MMNMTDDMETEIVLDQPTTLLTAGDGLWSKESLKQVLVTKLVLRQHDYDGKVYGSLDVYFDPKSWDVDSMGLIYTDSLFETQLMEFLMDEAKIITSEPYVELDYSEQGMQGVDYVNFDVDGAFVRAWHNYLSGSKNSG